MCWNEMKMTKPCILGRRCHQLFADFFLVHARPLHRATYFDPLLDPATVIQ
jgi:hypothetical protein